MAKEVSVILTCWKRFTHFEDILKAWLSQVDEVLIWDNSGSFKTDLPVLIVSSNKNIGVSARYLLAGLCKNNIIVIADDDIIPKPGLIDDLLKLKEYNTIKGIAGRIIYDQYSNHMRIDANKISKPAEVQSLLGSLIMIHKEHLLGQDITHFPWYSDDLYFQSKLTIKKFVIPTDKYKILPEATDENALYLQPGALEEKEKILNDFRNHTC